MKHLLEISLLTPNDIQSILKRAADFKANTLYPRYTDNVMANLFYENSTRTRVSFELAAKRLGLTVINMDLQNSSEAKGEIIEDTLQTLRAMGIDLFVIRHRQEGIQAQIAKHLGEQVNIINAGDGTHAHPSQALLDMMTILENKPDLSSLKIALVGNIRHSRVANSLQVIAQALGVAELRLIAPKTWQPEKLIYGQVTDSLKEGLFDADVVIALRVQKERLEESARIDLSQYRQEYAITEASLKYAKPDAIVMHPGPINRGIEIDSAVADGPQSRILDQVTNGVFVRMAILELLLNSK